MFGGCCFCVLIYLSTFKRAAICSRDTWLILPVVICFVRGLSHACLSMNTFCTVKLQIAHYISYSLFDDCPVTRITVVILELIRAQNRDSSRGKAMYLLDTKTNIFCWWFIIIVRNACFYSGVRSFKFLPYHAFDGSVVDYHGFDGWRRIGVRFRRGSLRNGYHIQGRQQARKLPNANTVRQRKTITIAGLTSFANRNEYNLNSLTRI